MKRVYQFIEDSNYIMFLIAYIIICCMIFMILGRFGYSDIKMRFKVGLPLILQLILTYIVYRENRKILSIRFLFIVVFLHTFICGILSLYELYFTYPSFGDDLMFYVLYAQMILQVVLALLLILLVDKQVDKLVVVKPLLMALFPGVIVGVTGIVLEFYASVDINLFFWIFLITFFINYFNPVLLYIVSYTAKGKLVYKR